jgi:hypothetical protein
MGREEVLRVHLDEIQRGPLFEQRTLMRRAPADAHLGRAGVV